MLSLTSLDLSAMDIAGFCTASGEILDDMGGASQVGYSEHGRAIQLNGKLLQVHKPLVSMSQIANKDSLAIMTDEGGSVIDASSVGGRLVKAVLDKIRRSTRGGEHVRLYNENGVYNFYLQDNKGVWKRYNLDSGAAVTVFPVHDEQNAVATASSSSSGKVTSAPVSGNRGQASP